MWQKAQLSTYVEEKTRLFCVRAFLATIAPLERSGDVPFPFFSLLTAQIAGPFIGSGNRSMRDLEV
jgi:hypothetical protein